MQSKGSFCLGLTKIIKLLKEEGKIDVLKNTSFYCFFVCRATTLELRSHSNQHIREGIMALFLALVILVLQLLGGMFDIKSIHLHVQIQEIEKSICSRSTNFTNLVKEILLTDVISLSKEAFVASNLGVYAQHSCHYATPQKPL